MGSVLFEELTRLVEAADEELHHNDRAGRPIPLQSKRLKAAHRHARNASALADHTARNFPVDQQRWLHSKAAEKHVHASHMARDDGFSHLAGMHHQAAQYHAAKAQQGHASSGLVHHAPSAGHGRAGHTLPAQPEVGPGQAAQTPTGSVSPTRARAAGQHWNARRIAFQRTNDSRKKREQRTIRRRRI